MSDGKVLSRRAKVLFDGSKPAPKESTGHRVYPGTGAAWEDKKSYPRQRGPAKKPAKYKGWDNAWISISFYDGRWHDVGRACTVGFGLKPTRDAAKMEAALQEAVTKIVRACLGTKGVKDGSELSAGKARGDRVLSPRDLYR